jgi:hypothetical protein
MGSKRHIARNLFWMAAAMPPRRQRRGPDTPFEKGSRLKEESRLLWEQRKLHDVFRSERPRCGARTRKRTPCKAQALKNGRCFIHGGLSTGPRTEEGKTALRKAVSERMRRLWAQLKAEGRSLPRPKLTAQGRKRISEAQKRRWRIYRTPRRLRVRFGMPLDAPCFEDKGRVVVSRDH